MPSLRLSNPFRRGADRPSLKQRAAALRAKAARVMRRPASVPDDPFEGLSPPAGFVPYPFEAPMSWVNIRCVLKNEGDRLLRLAVDELGRRLDAYEASGFGADEIRRHETRLRRELRIDALTEVASFDDPRGEVALIAGEGTDADLIALGREFDAARLREQAAQREAGQRDERAQARMPERPDCLTFRREDHRFNLRQMHEHPDEMDGSAVTVSDIQWMSRGPLRHQVLRPVRPGERAWRDFPGQIPEMVPFVEAQARADEILAAWAAWQADIARVNTEEGVYEAEETADLATEAMETVGRRIAGAPAHTVEGMCVKLRALNYVEGFGREAPDLGSALTWSLLRDAGVKES